MQARIELTGLDDKCMITATFIYHHTKWCISLNPAPLHRINICCHPRCTGFLADFYHMKCEVSPISAVMNST